MVDKSNKMINSQDKITKKQQKYFTYKYQKVTNLGKIDLLPKIHKRLSNIRDRSVISNCATPAEKVSDFFSIEVFFRNHSQITGLQGKGEGISLTPHCHFHQLHRHLYISWVITAESSPL